MKLSDMILILMMLGGEGVTVTLALTNPRVANLGLAAVLAVLGFVGTAMFFGRIGQNEIRTDE